MTVQSGPGRQKDNLRGDRMKDKAAVQMDPKKTYAGQSARLGLITVSDAAARAGHPDELESILRSG